MPFAGAGESIHAFSGLILAPTGRGIDQLPVEVLIAFRSPLRRSIWAMYFGSRSPTSWPLASLSIFPLTSQKNTTPSSMTKCPTAVRPGSLPLAPWKPAKPRPSLRSRSRWPPSPRGWPWLCANFAPAKSNRNPCSRRHRPQGI